MFHAAGGLCGKAGGANGSSTAKAYFDADGWCACHNSDIWGATYPAGFPDGDGDSSCYAVWFMSGRLDSEPTIHPQPVPKGSGL